jgi:hypothetical protein
MNLGFAESFRLEHSWLGREQFILALVHPAQDTVAASALRSCGVSYEAMARALGERYGDDDAPERSFDPEDGVLLSPAGHQLLARAEGLALGMGDPSPSLRTSAPHQTVTVSPGWGARADQTHRRGVRRVPSGD